MGGLGGTCFSTTTYLGYIIKTNMITDKKEQKQYIIRNWNSSSGERIAEMLKRYFVKEKERTLEETANLASKIFV